MTTSGCTVTREQERVVLLDDFGNSKRVNEFVSAGTVFGQTQETGPEIEEPVQRQFVIVSSYD